MQHEDHTRSGGSRQPETFIVSVEILDRRISDLLHGHGGQYSPWLHELSGEWDSAEGATARFDREGDDEGDGTGTMTIRREDVARGLSFFVRDHPSSFAQFMSEDDDDMTFDVFVQCVIFGKTIYG